MKWLRRLTCAVFSHEEEWFSPERFHLTFLCKRCGQETKFRFDVEDGFLERYGYEEDEGGS